MKPASNASFIEYIYSWADRSGGPTSCWPWRGMRDKNGYGRVHIMRTVFRVHRLSYELFYGTPPEGRLVCHSCDNPSCINPSHLFLGSAADNQRDMVEKGRGRTGERNGKAKLVAEEVQQIRALYATGEWTQHQLARRFGISQLTVSNIVTRKTWKHIE